MWNIKEQVISVANSLKVIVQSIAVSETESIISKVIEKYCGIGITAPLWENLQNEVAVNNKDAWQWIGDFIGDTETIMFFNPSDERGAFTFKKGRDVVSVLCETYGFEFYLTNKNLDYLICFNHHDVLIGCGNAADWVSKYKTKEYDAFLQET